MEGRYCTYEGMHVKNKGVGEAGKQAHRQPFDYRRKRNLAVGSSNGGL